MYTQMKTSLEQKQAKVKSLEQECKRKEADNQLINKQLKVCFIFQSSLNFAYVILCKNILPAEFFIFHCCLKIDM